MKFATYLVPAGAFGLAMIGLAQSDPDIGAILNILAELPVVALLTWLILKLDDRRRSSNEAIIEGFQKMVEADRQWHKELFKELLEVCKRED